MGGYGVQYRPINNDQVLNKCHKKLQILGLKKKRKIYKVGREATCAKEIITKLPCLVNSETVDIPGGYRSHNT